MCLCDCAHANLQFKRKSFDGMKIEWKYNMQKKKNVQSSVIKHQQTSRSRICTEIERRTGKKKLCKRSTCNSHNNQNNNIQTYRKIDVIIKVVHWECVCCFRFGFLSTTIEPSQTSFEICQALLCYYYLFIVSTVWLFIRPICIVYTKSVQSANHAIFKITTATNPTLLTFAVYDC